MLRGIFATVFRVRRVSYRASDSDRSAGNGSGGAMETKSEPAPLVCGVDPSGTGSDSTIHVLRDPFIAKIVRESQTDTPKSIANAMVNHNTSWGIDWGNFVIDSLGEGADVSKEVALAVYDADCTTVDLGRDRNYDKTRYLNTRARIYHDLQKWIKAGGKLYGEFNDWRELLDIQSTTDRGVLQIKGKDKMRKDGIRSPNKADALALTFYKPDYVRIEEEQEKERKKKRGNNNFNFFKV